MKKRKLAKYGIPNKKKFKKYFESVNYDVKINYSLASPKSLSEGILAKVSVYVDGRERSILGIFGKRKIHSSEEVIITGKGSFGALLSKCGDNSGLYRVLFEKEFENLSEVLINTLASEELIQSRYSNVCVSYRRRKTKITGVKKFN